MFICNKLIGIAPVILLTFLEPVELILTFKSPSVFNGPVILTSSGYVYKVDMGKVLE